MLKTSELNNSNINPELRKAILTVLKTCMGLKKSESCLIVSDSPQRDIGTKFFEVTSSITENAAYLEVPTMQRSGKEPSDEIAAIWKLYDVVIMTTSKSFSHTKARKSACKEAKTRIATMPGLTEDMAKRALNVNYDELKKSSIRLAKIIQAGSTVKMSTKLGTDVFFSIKKFKAFTDYGIYDTPGRFGNLPAGESGLAPDEDLTQGKLMIDACMGTGKLKEPVEITIKNGYATNFKGEEANKVRSQFENLGPKAFAVAEFAIGLNPKAKIIGINLEDEKVLGTAHVALGNNKSFGGTNDVQVHIDGIIQDPTIYIDNNLIMKEGKLMDLEKIKLNDDN